MATEPKPATSDTRVPQITRASTSRPTLSVPRRWAGPGCASAWPRSCLSGSSGETTGARIATATAASITATPNGASRAPAARRSIRHRRARTGRGAAGWAMAAGSAIPDPRVDPAIEEVHQQVAQDEAYRDEQHDALHERVVAREDRVHHETADAREGKDILRDYRPADQRAELKTQHRDDGDQGVLEDVAADDLPLRQPLGAGGADVVLRQRVEHAGPQRPRDHGRARHSERDRRQHQGTEPRQELFRRIRIAGDRKSVV